MGKAGSFGGDALEDIVDERVHNASVYDILNDSVLNQSYLAVKKRYCISS